MDIQLVTDNKFKLKGKLASLFTGDNLAKIETNAGESAKELAGPGEFEVAGISVIGIMSGQDTAYVYEIDNIRIFHFGNLVDTLPEGKLTQVGNIDILLLPMGPKSIEMMQQIEGYYIIPYGYNEEELEKFVKESGLTVKRLPKFALKKDEIIKDQVSEIIVLERK